jgi:hypothetical protein
MIRQVTVVPRTENLGGSLEIHGTHGPMVRWNPLEGIRFVILVVATYQDSTKSRSSEPRGRRSCVRIWGLISYVRL